MIYFRLSRSLSALVHKYTNVFLGSWPMGLRGFQLFEQGRQVLPGKFPLEGCGNAFVVALESVETLSQFSQGTKIIGCEGLALQHGKVDFDLIQPTGVDGTMDHLQM